MSQLTGRCSRPSLPLLLSTATVNRQPHGRNRPRPLEIETRRREREYRLASFELPLIRVCGSILLSIAIYITTAGSCRSRSTWMNATIVIAAHAAASWALLVVSSAAIRRGIWLLQAPAIVI
jgi:hypothetical protein